MKNQVVNDGVRQWLKSAEISYLTDLDSYQADRVARGVSDWHFVGRTGDGGNRFYETFVSYANVSYPDKEVKS